MNSTPNPKSTEPDGVLIVRADERPAYATEPPSQLERDAARHPSAVPGRRSSRGRPALRGLIGLLLATCIFIGAFVSRSAYGDAARLIIGQWATPLVLTSSLPLKRPGLPVQPSPSAAQVAAAEPMPPRPTPAAQTAPQEAAPTVAPLSPELAQMLQTIARDLANAQVAPLSPELAQMLQTMARDLANVQQGIEQLKTSQEQTASGNAKALEQLKTGQEQTASGNAKALEQLKTSQEQIDAARLIIARWVTPPVRLP
jgi:hypothetical protein